MSLEKSPSNGAVEHNQTSSDPLRIAYLTGEFPRATDTFIQREITALRRQGNDVQTFSIRRPTPEHLIGPEQVEAHADTHYLLETAKSGQLFSAHLRLLTKNPRRYLSSLKLAWDTRRFGVKGSIYQLFYFAEAGILAAHIKHNKINHLHNHFGDSSCTVAMLAGDLADVPFSFTLHGSAIFFEAHTWRLDEKIRRAAFCACISYFARAQAAIFAPDSLDTIPIVHCGVEPERLIPVDHAGQATRLLFIGRLADAKGLVHLFDAMAQLGDEFPDLRLTVVGDGPDRGRFEREASKRGLTPRVDFVGSKSQDEVVEVLAEHEIFVLPSYSEGVPVVLMEALGTGLAAVSTAVGGIGELVEDGVSGFLTRPGDADQLADRIRVLVEDAELRQAFGRAGRAKVADQFNSSTEAARLAQHFADASVRYTLDSSAPESLPSA